MASNLIRDGLQINCTVPSGTVSGDPVVINGLPGIAVTTRDSSGYAVVDFTPGKIWNLACKGIDNDGNSAIAEGDELFWTSGDTPKLSKKKSGSFWGRAIAATPGGSTTLVSAGATTTIHVRKAGDAGQGSVEGATIPDAAVTITNPAAAAASLTAANPTADAAAVTAVVDALTGSDPAALTSPAAGTGAGADGTTFSGAQCDALRADVSEIRDKLILANDDLGLQKVVTDALVADVTSAQAAVAANNVSIEALVVDVTALKAAVDANNAQIDAAVVDITALVTKLNAVLKALEYAGILASA